MKKLLSLALAVMLLISALSINNVSAFAAKTYDIEDGYRSSVLVSANSIESMDYRFVAQKDDVYYINCRNPRYDHSLTMVVEVFDSDMNSIDYFYNHYDVSCGFSANEGETYYINIKLLKPSTITRVDIAFYSDQNGYPAGGTHAYYNGLSYSLNTANKTASVEGPTSDHFEFIIASKIKGCKVTSIDNYAFRYCNQYVNKISISSTVKDIGNSAFAECSGLAKVTIDSANPYLKFVDGVLYNKDMTELLWYPNYLTNTSYTIPSSVKVINGGAFLSNEFLKSIYIPDSVETIEEEAFSGTKLKTVRIPSSVKYIGKKAFYNCAIKKLFLNEGLMIIEDQAFEKNLFETVNIPSTTADVNYRAFYDCTNLEKVFVKSTDAVFDEEVFIYDVTVYGDVNSTAQTYAEENDLDFVDIESVDPEQEQGPSGNPATCSHDETNIINVPATCTSSGAEITVCSYCGKHLNYEYVAPVEHTYQIISQKETTCTHSGETKYACTVCGTVYSEFTEVTAHDFETTVVDATHTSQGYTIKTCKNCGITEKSDYTPINEVHSYAVTKSVAPTCNKSGSITYTCSLCGNSYVELLGITDHSYVTNTVAPTCTSRGYTTYLCTACGETFDSDYQMKAEHYFTDKTVAPTCETKGYTLHTCADCGYEIKDSYTNATGHTPLTTEAVAPTCETAGLTAGSRCSVCGKVLEEPQIVTATDHTPVTDEAVAPSCTKSGLTEGTHCSVCGKVLSQQTVVNANGHSFSSVVSAPTCLSRGYTTYTCTVCGESYISDYTQASNDHDYKSADTTLPSCTAEGVRTYTCTICGNKYTDTIPMLEHTIVTDKAVAATFKASGKTEGSHCSVCGTVIEAQQTVPKLASPALSGVTAASKGFKASWKAVASIDGYQIQYAVNSSFSGAKTITVSGSKSTNKAVSKLTSKKKYYVRIRGYKTINGKKQYSSWSKSKSVTTK